MDESEADESTQRSIGLAPARDIWDRLKSVLPDRDFIRELGRGGMGSVVLLYNRKLKRNEALKVLLPELSEIPRFVERFLRESSVLSSLSHPNIITLYDGADSDEMLYILMDYVDGDTLRAAIAKDTLDLQQRVHIISQLADGLAYAHSNGVIHRDIKPANILLTQSNEVRIADFGLCKQDKRQPSQLSATRPQDVIGTYGYIAPELQSGTSSVDSRSDVYSLGVLCYELFTQRLPQGVFRPPSTDVSVSAQVDEVIMRALEQDPQLRYSDANEFSQAWQKIAKTAVIERAALKHQVDEKLHRKPNYFEDRKRHQFIGALGLIAFLIVAILYKSFFLGTETNSESIEGTTARDDTVLPRNFVVPQLELALNYLAPTQSIIGASDAQTTDASPPLQIELSYGFWMGVYEVTQLQYVNLMGTNPSHFNSTRTASSESPDNPGDWRNRPVESVTWREASAFCARLTEECRNSGVIPSNFRFRLPTEIEWETACRAGDFSDSPNHPSREVRRMQAWTREDFLDEEQTQAVGVKTPNAWGFHDMLGNVSEYCLNGWWYYRQYQDERIRDWIQGSESGDRIYRGGSFAHSAERANAYKRSSNAVDERDLAQGFRVVLSEELPFITEMLNSELPHWFEVDSLGLRMTWIPAGEFLRGEESSSTPRGPAVSPSTPTTISEGFWIGITEVTEFQWERTVNGDLDWLLNQETSPRDTNQDLPIANISWTEASHFCKQLTLALKASDRLPDGFAIRLPTEAEWEWACRREHSTLFSFGDDPINIGIQFSERARFRNNSNNAAGPVGEKVAGQSGLRGMYGNVREWCLDWKHSYPGTEQIDPLGKLTASSERTKALRGGDFLSDEALCTGTARSFASPDYRSRQIGVRIVLGSPIAMERPEETPTPKD